MILGFTPFECVCNCIFYFEFCVFIGSVLTPRFNKCWTYASYAFVILLALLGSGLFAKMSFMRILTLPVILMIYNLVFYRDKRLRCIFAAWMVPVIIFLSEIIVVALIYNPEMLQARLHEAPIGEQILCWGVEMLSAAFLYWCAALVLNRVRNHFRIRDMLMYVFFPVSQFLLLYGWINTSRELGQSTQQQLLILAVLVVCLVADVGLFASMILVSRQRDLEQENQLLARQIDVQRSHYAGLTVQFESIRSMRHDIAKHLTAISAMLSAGLNSEAAAYAAELDRRAYDRNLGICEHPVVDAYIYSAIQKGKEMGITVDAAVSVPADVNILPTDLICTYGNLLDNSFDACYQCPNSVIRVRTSVLGEYLVISTVNPLGPVKEQKSHIRGLERGIGFKVLGDLATKYNGNFHYFIENGNFCAEITYWLKG